MVQFNMYVVKRNGEKETVSFDKVLNRMLVLSNGLDVNVFEVAQKVCTRIYDGVKTSELDELAAHMCSSMITEHPDYGTLAARIIVSNHHKNTSPSFSETVALLYNHVDVHGEHNPLVSTELHDVVMRNKEKLNSCIVYDRDYLFDYFGFKTLEKAYLMRVNGTVVERPQHMWMRVSLGIHGKDVKDALETYDLMSRKYFTHATPTLFNSGTPRPQLSSCFVKGTTVYTKRGCIPIESVKIGDEVITHNSQFKRVKQLHVNSIGERRLFDFKCYLTPAITATDNHSFMSITQEQIAWKQKPQWNKLEHLRVGDFIEIPTYNGSESEPVIDISEFANEIRDDGNNITYSYSIDDTTISCYSHWSRYTKIHNVDRVLDFKRPMNTLHRFWSIDEDFCKFLGIWYGDGHIIKQKNSARRQIPKGIGITIDVRNQGSIEFCKEYGASLFGIEPCIHTMSNQNVVQVLFNSTYLGFVFVKLFGEYFHSKHIYDGMHTWDTRLIEALLTGLVSSDGFVTNEGMVRLGMCNPMLVKDLYCICRARGIFVSYVETIRKYKNKQGMETENVIAYMTIPRESAHLAKVNRYYKDDRMTRYTNLCQQKSTCTYTIDGRKFVRIMCKKPSESMDATVYNLGIEDDHSYMVEGLIAKNCFLLHMQDDSISGIFRTLEDCALISKYAGGIGLHIHNVRAKGSRIRGTNGMSDGIIPMLRVYNNTARYVNQSGRRNGSIAMYLEPWHADIQAFLEMKKNHGSEEERARDLFYALWVPDLFMERVKTGKMWSLMCPDECQGLSDVHSDEFKKLYERYEAEGKFKKQLPAQELWWQILQMQIEQGVPYLLFKDAANRKSNQQNLGTIKSSNLCVAGDTMILTEDGYYPIKDLVDTQVRVWNGKQFSDTVVRQTGRMQKLLTVKTSNGMEVRCTPYHKFYIEEGVEPSKKSQVKIVEAKDLTVGMRIIRYNTPCLNTSTEEMKYAYTHGLFCADGTYSKHEEELRHQCNYQKWNGTDFCKRHQQFVKVYDTEDKCCAESFCDKPLLFLYGEKKKLLKHIDYVYFNEDTTLDRLNLALPHDIEKKYYVPINASLNTKLKWLAGYMDGDGTVTGNNGIKNIQMNSVDKEFLQHIVLLLQTLGVESNLGVCRGDGKHLLPNGKGGHSYYNCKILYRVNISCGNVSKLVDLGLKTNRLQLQPIKQTIGQTRYVKITCIEDKDEYEDTYCFNEPLEHKGIFNGILSGQCSEIIEFTSPDEIAVCNLASIALPSYIEYDEDNKPYYNFKKLHDVAKVITKNLNKVIDINFYPVEKAKKSNFRHRPIGIGVQGLADTYILMRYPFDSPEAMKLNRYIFETIYHGSMESSMELSKKRGRIITEYNENKLTFDELSDKLSFNEYEVVNSKYPGAYTTFEGSPASKGQFQFDLWGVQPTSGLWDWETLKADVIEHGIRNSLLLAPMPTASTSQILSFNEAFEPFTSNLYKRKTLAGEFIIVNKYLIKDLLSLGLWDKDMKNQIIVHDGSIQNIPEIPQEFKNLYKTAWELKQKVLIDQSADRGAFVCQSQSLNLFMEDPDFKKLSSMHFYSWQKGLKTGIYYLRTKAKAQAQKFTIDPSLQKFTNLKIDKKEKQLLEQEQECTFCSS